MKSTLDNILTPDDPVAGEGGIDLEFGEMEKIVNDYRNCKKFMETIASIEARYVNLKQMIQDIEETKSKIPELSYKDLAELDLKVDKVLKFKEDETLKQLKNKIFTQMYKFIKMDFMKVISVLKKQSIERLFFELLDWTEKLVRTSGPVYRDDLKQFCGKLEVRLQEQKLVKLEAAAKAQKKLMNERRSSLQQDSSIHQKIEEEETKGGRRRSKEKEREEEVEEDVLTYQYSKLKISLETKRKDGEIPPRETRKRALRMEGKRNDIIEILQKAVKKDKNTQKKCLDLGRYAKNIMEIFSEGETCSRKDFDQDSKKLIQVLNLKNIRKILFEREFEKIFLREILKKSLNELEILNRSGSCDKVQDFDDIKIKRKLKIEDEGESNDVKTELKEAHHYQVPVILIQNPKEELWSSSPKTKGLDLSNETSRKPNSAKSSEPEPNAFRSLEACLKSLDCLSPEVPDPMGPLKVAESDL